MRAIASDVYLVAAVLFFLFTAWSSGVAPERFASQLGLGIANAGGTNEIRSQYAGFFLAAALVCAGALFGIVPKLSAFIVLATIFGGLIAGRLLSLALNAGIEGFGPAILALYAIDGAGFIVAVAMIIAGRQA
jgi:hypothetical protein